MGVTESGIDTVGHVVEHHDRATIAKLTVAKAFYRSFSQTAGRLWVGAAAWLRTFSQLPRFIATSSDTKSILGAPKARRCSAHVALDRMS